MKNITNDVLCSMLPKTFYRAKDVVVGKNYSESSARLALKELSQGGVIERVQQGRNVVFITKQGSLFR